MESQLKISLPVSLDLNSAMGLSIYFRDMAHAEKYIIDFGNVKNVEPFGMLMVSSQLYRLKHRHPDSEFNYQNYSNLSYAGHMGFFQAFGLNHGKKPGEANGSNTYIPLRIFKCDDLREEAFDEGVYVGDIIEKESQNLATILCTNQSGDIHETLAYSLREIMRNVVEHSESIQFGICAQYWPSKNKVEFAIVDGGIGLKKTLDPNPHLDVSDHKAAINYALMPAVSGKAYKGAKQKDKGPWANSGFGLYMTNRICRNGGNFFVASGDTGMLLTSKGGKKYYPCDFSGTAVRMIIDTNKIGELNKSLNKYKNEGFEIQRTYREIVNIDPSSASLMLSKDFDVSLWKKMLSALKNL